MLDWTENTLLRRAPIWQCGRPPHAGESVATVEPGQRLPRGQCTKAGRLGALEAVRNAETIRGCPRARYSDPRLSDTVEAGSSQKDDLRVSEDGTLPCRLGVFP